MESIKHFSLFSVLVLVLVTTSCTKEIAPPPAKTPELTQKTPLVAPNETPYPGKPELSLKFAERKFETLRLACQTVFKAKVNKEGGTATITEQEENAPVSWDLLKDFSTAERSFTKNFTTPDYLRSSTPVQKGYDVALYYENTFKVTPQFLEKKEYVLENGTKVALKDVIGFAVKVEGRLLDGKKNVLKNWTKDVPVLWGAEKHGPSESFVTFENKSPKFEHALGYECTLHELERPY